jgi:hypothetical protein
MIKTKDNKLKFRCFLNNFINRKGVLGLCKVVGFRLGVRRAMPLALTKGTRDKNLDEQARPTKLNVTVQ